MCWAACDRLARIAVHLNLADRAAYWRIQADRIHEKICQRAWSDRKRAFAASFEGDSLDASLLLLHDLGFLSADDPRFVGTVTAIERELKHGNYIYR